jgi:hypothetical protein
MRRCSALRAASRRLPLSLLSVFMDDTPNATSSGTRVASVEERLPVLVDLIARHAHDDSRDADESVDIVALHDLQPRTLAEILTRIPSLEVAGRDEDECAFVAASKASHVNAMSSKLERNAGSLALETLYTGAIAPAANGREITVFLRRKAAPWQATVAWGVAPLAIDLTHVGARGGNQLSLRICSSDMTKRRALPTDDEILKHEEAHAKTLRDTFRRQFMDRLLASDVNVYVGRTGMLAQEMAGNGFRDALFDAMEQCKKRGAAFDEYNWTFDQNENPYFKPQKVPATDVLATDGDRPGGVMNRFHRCLYRRPRGAVIVPVLHRALKPAMPSNPSRPSGLEASDTRPLLVRFDVDVKL